MTAHTVVATGSYSSSGRGRGAGIDLLAVDPAVPSLARLASLPIEDASFLVWSPDGTPLYAVQETSPTRLVALKVSTGAEEVELAGSLDLTGSGGRHVAHGAVAGTLVVTDYGSGHVEVVGLDADGLPERVLDVCDHTTYRHGGEPHPHQTVLPPGTPGLLAVSDLGLDRVYVYAQAADGSIDLAGEVALSRGQGPRHLATDHESRSLYIACEVSGELAVAVRARPAPGSAPSGGTEQASGAPAWSVVSGAPRERHGDPGLRLAHRAHGRRGAPVRRQPRPRLDLRAEPGAGPARARRRDRGGRAPPALRPDRRPRPRGGPGVRSHRPPALGRDAPEHRRDPRPLAVGVLHRAPAIMVSAAPTAPAPWKDPT